MIGINLSLIALNYLAPLLVLPLVGAAFLVLSFKAAGVPGLTYLQCWKAFLGTVAYGFLALVAANYTLPAHGASSPQRLVLLLGAAGAVQLLVLPLLLRKFTWRAVLAQELAVVLTNVLTVVVLVSMAH